MGDGYLSNMCGRSSLHDHPTNILDRFSLPPVLPEFSPRYNIAPSQLQWAIAGDPENPPALMQLKWGLVPSFADDPTIGNRLINARAESLLERPAFRDSFRSRRCAILADGYYEWAGKGKNRTPMYFRLSDGRAFGLAGLWDRWDRGDHPLETCTVITTDASAVAAQVHNRMPVLLVDDAIERWLDGSLRPSDLGSLLRPYERDDLETYEVSRYVNSPANDSPECISRTEVLRLAL